MNPSKEEEALAKKQLYSRQEYVVGAEIQGKYGATDVLVVGLSGPASEIVKNLALTGVRTIFLLDNEPIHEADLGCGFFYTQEDVGQVRSRVMSTAASQLNRFVRVVPAEGELANLIPTVHVVVFVNHFTCTLIEANRLARSRGVKFVACEARGLTCSLFVDGGAEDFIVVDKDGEETNTCIITSISPSGLVSLHEDRKHECEVGSEVVLTGIVSPSALNTPMIGGSPYHDSAKRFVVEQVLTPFVLQLKDVSSLLQSSAIEVGTAAYLHTTKPRATIQFRSLKESLQEPQFSSIFDSDAKTGGEAMLLALYKAVGARGQLPRSPEEVEALIHAAKTVCAPDVTIDEALAAKLLHGFSAEFHPLACVVGGLASQEVLKLCSGKFTPVQQWWMYDVRELLLLPSFPPAATAGSPSRFDSLKLLFGEEFHAYLARQRAFIVGAGALGCELMKNVSLLGLGGVSVTDCDTIEMSNLSRQFLFRDQHIGQPKALVAAQSVKKINPALQVSAYTLKVGPETEGTFDEAFWARHGVVLNALDNVSSRIYVDSRCLFYQRPLIESGTLGTKCNVQCVIPYVTESYGQSYDPPEKSIPLCTLKNFPNAIEHTIQWARDQFHLLFQTTPDDVNQYVLNFSGFAAIMERDPGGATTILRLVNDALRCWPESGEDCIKRARLLYHEFFTETFQQLLHNIPLDKRNEDGSLFWSGAKKPPTPLEFQPSREEDAAFVYHTACLLTKIYGLPPLTASMEEVAAAAAAVPVPSFVPRVVVFATSENDKSGNAGQKQGGDLQLRDLPPPQQFSQKRMKAEAFEKDDLTNHHMQFITSCSNLRALAYGIPPSDLFTTKRIAGKIVPAMVTTTSLVTGLVCIEMLKYFLLGYQRLLQGFLRGPSPPPSLEEVQSQLQLYRNSFVNIALPLFAFSDPIIAKGTTIHLPESGKTIRWSNWDRLDINEGRDISVKELVAVLADKFELEVSMLSLTSGKLLFMAFGGKAKDKERLVSELAAERGEALKDGCDYLDVVATGSIGEEFPDVPIIRYKFRNF